VQAARAAQAPAAASSRPNLVKADIWQRRPVEQDNRFIEPVACDEQVHADWRCAIAYLHVRKKDHPEMNRVDAESCGNWQNQGDNDDQG
jgi:hypothetical protein